MSAKATLLIGIICIITLSTFGVMVHLMMSINPPPLPEEKVSEKPFPIAPGLELPYMSVVRAENNAVINPSRRAFDEHANDYSEVSDDYRNLMLNTIQKVIPPLWPLTPPEPPQDGLGQRQEDAESKSKVYVATANNESLVILGKRSVDDGDTLKSDLDSIILKVTDDTGQFNIEIKIGTNDAPTKKQIETREIKSKDVRKYSMFLKTKNNDLFQISELAKSTIMQVKSNDSVSIDNYDDHQKSKRTVNQNKIKTSIMDLINNTDKSAVMPMDKDLLNKGFFSNKEKFTNHSDPNAKENKEFSKS